MRIAFVVSELRYSGGIRVVVEYANRLARRGHTVSIVTSSVRDAPAVLPIDDAVRIIAAPFGLDRRGSLHNCRLALELARRVPQGDVVIPTHTPTVVPALLAARGLRRGAPVWLDMDYPEMFSGRPLQSWLYRHASPWFNLVLCLSASGPAELSQLGRAPSHCVVVGVGLSDSELLTPGNPALRNRHEVLYVGDSRPRKGLDDLFVALALTRERVPDATLVVASKEDLQHRLRADAPIPYRFYHWPDRAALAQLYRTCGVFVSASWAEGFGLPPLEAMACRAPVVLTDSRGVREYARGGANCLLVPPRNPSALADAISRLLLDESLADRLGMAGPATASAFNWGQAVDRLERALLGSVP